MQARQPRLFQLAVKRIRSFHRELGPAFGWRFLYCPARLLSPKTRLMLVGINPGGQSRKGRPSQERGNAYNVERWSRDGEVLRRQVVQFFCLIAQALKRKNLSGSRLLDETLTANFYPFHSHTWHRFPRASRRRVIEFSRLLWSEILPYLNPRVMVCMGKAPFREFQRLFERQGYILKLRESVPTGWGGATFRIVEAYADGRTTSLVYLPHLSQFKLLHHRRSDRALRRICDAIALRLRAA